MNLHWEQCSMRTLYDDAAATARVGAEAGIAFDKKALLPSPYTA